MLGRSCAPVLVLVLASVSSGALADTPRPAGTGTGEALAKVHLVGGSGIKIRATSGAPFSPRPTMALYRTDTIVVPANEFVVVHLTGNNHLVRIDDDVTLKVGDIVLLSAKRNPESLGAQLNRMVTRDEQRSAERIAGTYAGRAAGDAAPPEASSSFGSGGLGLRGTGEGGGGSGEGIGGIGSVGAKGSGSGRGYGASGGSARASDSNESKKAAPAPRAAAAAPRPAAQPAAPAPAPSPAPSPAPVVAAAPAPPPPPPPPPAAIAPAARSEAMAPAPGGTTRLTPTLPHATELQKCVAGELRRLGVKLPKVTLRLRIEGGKIRRFTLGGGLAAPACARPLLLEQPYEGADQTWQNVDLPTS